MPIVTQRDAVEVAEDTACREKTHSEKLHSGVRGVTYRENALLIAVLADMGKRCGLRRRHAPRALANQSRQSNSSRRDAAHDAPTNNASTAAAPEAHHEMDAPLRHSGCRYTRASRIAHIAKHSQWSLPDVPGVLVSDAAPHEDGDADANWRAQDAARRSPQCARE